MVVTAGGGGHRLSIGGLMHVVDKFRILPVLAGAAVVVGGLNVASYAANGHALTLGA